jgi:hypothetical protein
MLTHIEEYGTDYAAARKRAESKSRAGHFAEFFPCEADGVVRWRVRWDAKDGLHIRSI